MTKESLLKILFDEGSLRNIDVAVAVGSVPKGHEQFYVTDYNHGTFGKLVNLRTLAFEKKIENLNKLFPLNPYVATIYIEFAGDRSVGINPWTRTATVHRDCVSDDESREYIKKEFVRIYSDLEDFYPKIYIDDELIFEVD